MKETILVIDDDRSILEVIKIILEDKGYCVITNTNATAIATQIVLQKPNLILMDIWMPNNNGGAITKQLKSHAETKKIPIILVSANNDTASIAKTAGADDFLTKPFDIADLISKVEKYAPLST